MNWEFWSRAQIVAAFGCYPARHDDFACSSLTLSEDGQDVAKSVMSMLSEVAHVSPRFPAARTKHWASVKVALQGLGVPPDAIARCKQVVLQVSYPINAHLSKTS